MSAAAAAAGPPEAQPLDCPACGSPSSRPWGSKNGCALSICRTCGTIFTWVLEIAATQVYDHYYDSARFEILAVVEASLEQLVRSCEESRCPGRWPDVVHGEALLCVAQRLGLDCYGSEVSARVLDYGRSQGGWSPPDAARTSGLPRPARRGPHDRANRARA